MTKYDRDGVVKAIEDALPVTFYAGMALPNRVRTMAEMWNRVVLVNKDLEAERDQALASLRELVGALGAVLAAERGNGSYVIMLGDVTRLRAALEKARTVTGQEEANASADSQGTQEG